MSKRGVLFLLSLFLPLGASCKSPSARNSLSLADSGVDVVESIRISVRDEAAPGRAEASVREIEGQRIFEPGVVILGSEAGEALDRLRSSSVTSFSARWIDEGERIPPAGSVRRVVFQRVLEFSDFEGLRRFFGPGSEDALARAEVRQAGGRAVVVAELAFTLVPAQNGRACRLELDGIRARRDTARVLRMLQHEGSIDLSVAFTFRTVGDSAQSQTVLFTTTLRVEGSEWRCDGQRSDWFPPGAGSGPWSVQVTIFDREEIQSAVDELGEAAEFLLDVVGRARKANVF